ncbi:MAG TPA: zf-HC2 domain-containing protein [bacterium]|nr:zf-HC2 domain-containing protein [bacterium]
MTCRETRDALIETVTGRTPPDLRRAVAAHLEVCANCRREAARFEETVALLRAGPDPDPPLGFWPGFMVQLEERIAREPVGLWARLRRRLTVPALGPAAATAVVVVVFVVSTLLRPALGPGPEAQTPNPLAPYLTDSMRTLLPSLEQTVQIWQSGLGGTDADPLYLIQPEGP